MTLPPAYCPKDNQQKHSWRYKAPQAGGRVTPKLYPKTPKVCLIKWTHKAMPGAVLMRYAYQADKQMVG